MLYKLLPDGRRQVVEVIGEGEVFGITCLPIYDCSAETLVAAEVIAYDRAAARSRSSFLVSSTARVDAQFCAMHDHVVLLGRKSALERVASFVMHCVPGRGGVQLPRPPRAGDDFADIPLGMTRHEIADYLGLTIETVSRVFSEFRRRGMVDDRRTRASARERRLPDVPADRCARNAASGPRRRHLRASRATPASP